MVSYSITPEVWHQQVVVSFQAQARGATPSSPPGTSRAAACPPARSRSGSKRNRETDVAYRSVSPATPGTSESVRLTTSGRRRPASRIWSSPTGLAAPSTHASGTFIGPLKGTACTPRSVIGPCAGGTSSRSHDSIAWAGSRGSCGCSRRASSFPVVGGSSVHSMPSAVGSEKCTTTESSSASRGEHSSVNDSVKRSSRTVSRTCVCTSMGGRRRSSRSVRLSSPSLTNSRSRTPLSPASLRSPGGSWSSGTESTVCPAPSMVISAFVRISRAAASSLASFSISSDDRANGSPSRKGPRWPITFTRTTLPRETPLTRPILSRLPSSAASTRQSARSVRLGISTESISHPGAT